MASENSKKKRVTFWDVRREAWALISAHKRWLMMGFGLMVIGQLAGLVMPFSSKFVIDTVLGEGRGDLLMPVALLATLATLVQAGTSFGLSQVVSITAQRAIRDLRAGVQQHVIRLPVAFFDSTKSGVLISRVMNDPEGVRNLVGTGIVQIAGGLLRVLIVLVIMLFVNWQLTLAAVGLLIAFAASMAMAFKKLRPIFRERWEIQSQVSGRLGEALGGVRLLKVYVAEEREHGVFREGVDRLFRNIARTITATSAVTAFTTVIVGGVGILIMVIGGRAILAGTMSLGDLVMYVLLAGYMVAPLVQIANIGTQITEAFAGLDRIREIRERSTEDHDDENREPITDISGDLVFDDVSFEYETDVPVLRNVSFHARAGTTTALVGPSGAGKSTMIGLIMAFSRPTSGRIDVDGRDLSNVKLRGYRTQLGVVMQDNFLFDGTIRENIAFSNPSATEDEVRAAGRIAHCDEFVERFEKQYDTIVGERGVKLSGGQRQRVAIARAILADPRILILDEATSSLDSESEALIRDGLRSLRRGRTTFVIAHRLSTIQSADQILVMDEGRIIESGTHASLLRNGGLYRRLYEKQRGVEIDIYVNPGEDPIPDEPSDHPQFEPAGSRPPRNL